MSFRIEYSIASPLGREGRMPASFGVFDSLEEARPFAGWAARENATDVEIVEIESHRWVETVPAPQ